MQARELAGLETVGGGDPRHPAFPAGGDLVVANVRGVAEEQGRAVRPREHDRPIVLQTDGETIDHVQRGRIGPQHERRQRIDLHGNQLGVGERPAGGEKEAPRASARIDDARRGLLAGGPCDHGIDDGPRGVDRPLPAARLRRTDPAEGAAERVAAPSNGLAKLTRMSWTRRPALGNECPLGLGKGRIRTGQGERERRKVGRGRYGRRRLLSCRVSSHGARARPPRMLSCQRHAPLRRITHLPLLGAQRRRLRPSFPPQRQLRPRGADCKPRPLGFRLAFREAQEGSPGCGRRPGHAGRADRRAGHPPATPAPRDEPGGTARNLLI